MIEIAFGVVYAQCALAFLCGILSAAAVVLWLDEYFDSSFVVACLVFVLAGMAFWIGRSF